MCRWLAYTGPPVLLTQMLIDQACTPGMGPSYQHSQNGT